MIMITICKILGLTAKIMVLSILIPFILLYSVLMNFAHWLKQEWMKMGMTDEEKKDMHNKLLASYVGCKYEKKKDCKIIKDNSEGEYK